MTKKQSDAARAALDAFEIELPSWEFSDAGGRPGKPRQDAAAIDLEDKLADAGQVHRLAGCCPGVAVQARGDFEPGADPRIAERIAASHGVRIGSIDPTLFLGSRHRWGALAHDDPGMRGEALRQCFESIRLGRMLKSETLSLRLAEGLGGPGRADFRTRKRQLEAGLRACHRRLGPTQMLLLECNPDEPARGAADLADWGMAWLAARQAGSRAKVLIEVGHPSARCNLEQIAAFLLDEEGLGGIAINPLDPCRIFRVFHEVLTFSEERGAGPRIVYRADPWPDDRPRIEAMLQTVLLAQELYVKAALVDRPALRRAQAGGDATAVESELTAAFFFDAGPAIADWRRSRGLPRDPLAAYRRSGYEARVTRDRHHRRGDRRTPRADRYV